MKARILNIQRMSTEDGPGIRSTVFFKGCTLRCRWCQNPESIPARPQLAFDAGLCMGCGSCREACPQDLLVLEAEGPRRREGCGLCAACVEACPTGAMELLGREWELDEVMEELLRDRAYFERSGGGVTFSGGEPAMQGAFAIELAAACRAEGLHLAVDTCGQASPEVLEGLARRAQLLLYDLKVVDDGRHRELCGQGTELILANLARVAALDLDLWIRTPLVPGDTDTDDNLRAIARLLAADYPQRFIRWELCAFNRLCEDKYRRLGLVWPYAGAGPTTRERAQAIRDLVLAEGLDGTRVRVTGLGGEET